jgi:hypothetical protein
MAGNHSSLQTVRRRPDFVITSGDKTPPSASVKLWGNPNYVIWNNQRERRQRQNGRGGLDYLIVNNIPKSTNAALSKTKQIK